MTIVEILRQFHLCIEAAVIANQTASRDYEDKLWDDITMAYIPRLIAAIETRRQRPNVG